MKTTPYKAHNNGRVQFGGLVLGMAIVWLMSTWPVDYLQAQTVDKSMIELSEKLLYAVKTEQPTDSIIGQLATHSANDLSRKLSNDKARKTFWINIYNACYQLLATKKGPKASHIFSEKAIRFSNVAFSLDEVEHGILRRYRWKYSLGYLPQLFPGRVIKQLAVDTLDYRIHFALNCGAKSCPPIAFYSYDQLDDQLTLATTAYLNQESAVDSVNRIVIVPKLMQWFKGDFSGSTGIRAILTTYLGQDVSGYSIQYRDYDWSEDLRKYK